MVVYPKIEILYQDEFIVAVNKPANMIVHPGQGGNYEKFSVMKLVKHQIGKWVYPIHRLDRPTSGVLLLGLDKEFTSKLMQNWSNTRKFYYALICGDYKEQGEFKFALKDRGKVNRDTGEKSDIYKDSHTLYWPIDHLEGVESKYTLCNVETRTGRMHQIRRHFARCVTPLVGDTKYGKAKFNNELRNNYEMRRLFLHCHTVGFVHPNTGEEVVIKCELSPELKESLKLMKLKI
jgi:tRNA pseudouridine65 synthase